MKKKLILICAFGLIAIIFIYYSTINNKVKLLTLGDGIASGMTAYNVTGYSYGDYLKDYFKKQNHLQSYINNFAEANKTISNLLDEINKNYSLEINKEAITIQQAIKKANVIIIAIGQDELTSRSLSEKINNKDLNNYYKDITQLLKYIRKINHERVILIGLFDAYNLNNVSLINDELSNIAKDLDCDFLDISNTVKNEEYFFNDTSYYFNYKGHKRVSEELIKLI